MQKLKWKKAISFQIIAWVVLSVFTVDTTVWSAPVLGLPLSEVAISRPKIEIPHDLGTIKDEFWNSQSTSLVLHIQDAHGNYEAQTHIKNQA